MTNGKLKSKQEPTFDVLFDEPTDLNDSQASLDTMGSSEGADTVF